MADQQNLAQLVQDIDVLADEDLQHIIERWPYLLPEQRDMMVATIDDLLSDRGAW
ncbi:hypothetical protein ANRL4_01410 [Anaerolineae bacterium]|nr:hypothetical protein ANRL4_01410 [Anaerolineae bacterium]